MNDREKDAFRVWAFQHGDLTGQQVDELFAWVEGEGQEIAARLRAIATRRAKPPVDPLAASDRQEVGDGR